MFAGLKNKINISEEEKWNEKTRGEAATGLLGAPGLEEGRTQGGVWFSQGYWK